ncbi:uncharacterized protein BP01DRAFT_10493 [Aspergillus saccharolyticus JOP 1030-1]|uniref:Uncharacterized protein n=1 Tax=Aspergillus saccharolyticus JOP 1030-1 TaxID=1450539 RepID=A0A319A0C0_9EURO|nr:hypothetical protein BP01DRAFT_10493 [Aspergillus saccharolyticus JOP 1030-1]PYH49960.1 hypothetical protein BP01DRAFT_10493 [Aspergillus saccharolyticus JOP 1030-1]
MCANRAFPLTYVWCRQAEAALIPTTILFSLKLAVFMPNPAHYVDERPDSDCHWALGKLLDMLRPLRSLLMSSRMTLRTTPSLLSVEDTG